jgi:hypothetical protein
MLIASPHQVVHGPRESAMEVGRQGRVPAVPGRGMLGTPHRSRAIASVKWSVLPLNRGGRAPDVDGVWCGGGDIGVGAH